MGVVHRGWLYFNPRGPYAGTPATPVAVKALHPSLAGRAHVRKLFLGEAEALRKLSHPNIVRFFGLAEAGETAAGNALLAIVMELVDGEPLSKVIERHVHRATAGGLPSMPFARAWHYFQQLLGALAATHELGIVHRDVKPANLLIRRDGAAKLTDYGIARLPADAVRDSGGLQPGTGAYMSPEQVLAKPLDGRSDLYAAAIVLYEMITGRTPFDAPDRSELVVRTMQVEATPPAVRTFLPQAPPVVDAIFARALAKDPAARFATAIDLGNAFRDALGLPDSAGWQAQQVLAENALGIAAPGTTRKGRGGTVPIPARRADQLRAAISAAYRSGE